jgi:hypothetical protein
LQIAFNLERVELEIRPEPDEAEREAIVAAVAQPPGAPTPYASAWRRAALVEAVEAEET